jgi:menaquinol-cytochrome c reductase iron-sulfur subunit
MEFLKNFLERLGLYVRPEHRRSIPRTDKAGNPGCGEHAEPVAASGGRQFEDRRQFLHRMSIALSGVAAALVGLPFVGFLFASRRETPETAWRVIGTLEDFPVGETQLATYLDPAPLPWAGFSARTAAWVRHEGDGQFTAFSAYCTHVGCPVRWLEESHLFMCPCHGGSFYRDGSVAGGPPRQALDRYAVRARNGQVEILAVPQPLPT